MTIGSRPIGSLASYDVVLEISDHNGGSKAARCRTLTDVASFVDAALKSSDNLTIIAKPYKDSVEGLREEMQARAKDVIDPPAAMTVEAAVAAFEAARQRWERAKRPESFPVIDEDVLKGIRESESHRLRDWTPPATVTAPMPLNPYVDRNRPWMAQ